MAYWCQGLVNGELLCEVLQLFLDSNLYVGMKGRSEGVGMEEEEGKRKEEERKEGKEWER